MNKRHLRKAFSLLAALLLLLACVFPAGAEEAASGLTKDVVILFTSDIHCGVNQGFTMAGLSAIKETAQKTNHVLMVDNGDAIQGEAIGAITRGKAIIELMNILGYDAAIPGNHEFDYGMNRFLELVDMAEFPYLSCNFNRNGELVFDPYRMFEFDGVKIALVGICTPQSLISSTPRYFQDENGNFIYGFYQGEDGVAFYQQVQDTVDKARAEGADYVIALAHLGELDTARPYTYADLIEHVRGLDAVLDGHSHDSDHAEVIDPDGRVVVRQACGTKMESIGWLRISAADGSVSAGIYTWINSNGISLPLLIGMDSPMMQAAEKQFAMISDELAEVVGNSSDVLTIYDPTAKDENGKAIRIVRVSETNMGDLAADAIRWKSGADVALVNAGGIRSGLPKGPITFNDIMTVFPYGNKVVMIEATGQQLLNALEWAAKSLPSENGAFLQVSGITLEIDLSVSSSCTADENGFCTGYPGEYRVKNVTVGGEPLDPEKTYRVASIDYVALANGDGTTAFDGANLLWEAEVQDFHVLKEYIRDGLNGVIGEEYANPYGSGRITVLPKPAE